jgi:hypothetical protein
MSGFDPVQLAGELHREGFVLDEDLDGEQISRRYYGTSANALRPLVTSHYALATVPVTSAWRARTSNETCHPRRQSDSSP